MTLRVERRQTCVRLRLDHPGRRNALDAQTCAELDGAIAELARATSTSVVVLEGTDPVFCAGVDLREPSPQGSWQERRISAGNWQRVLNGLADLPQATIASIQGAAIRAGLMLALAYDLRVVAQNAILRLPELSWDALSPGARCRGWCTPSERPAPGTWC